MKTNMLLFLWITVLSSSALYGQSAVAELHFESAEKAYNAGKYREALDKLDETEQLAGVMSKTLYLRIVTQDKLLKQSGIFEEEGNFALLSDLRSHAQSYLEVMADHGLDDRYREVYAIHEQLAKYPKTLSEWTAGRHQFEESRKREHERAIKRAEEQRIEKELTAIRTERKSVYDSQMFEASDMVDSDTGADNLITVYIIRPEDNGPSTTQALFVNEEIHVPKLEQGEHVVLHCTPGLLRIGVLDDEEFVKQRKRRRSRAILAGGVIGLAATSGKVASRNADPLLLNLDGTQNTYYIRTAVDSKSRGGGVNYWEISEAEAKPLLEDSKQIKE